jgi:UDP-glucose 4-epimerase
VYGANFEDSPRRVPDVRKAQRLLGFAVQIDLEEGVRRTVQWWIDSQSSQRSN